MSDRIICIYRGAIYSELSGDEIKENLVLASCSGVKNRDKKEL